jgi:hypothetical protein
MATLFGAAAGAVSFVGDDFYLDANTKQITKIDAMKQLLTTDNKALVYRCRRQQLSRKGTVTNR